MTDADKLWTKEETAEFLGVCQMTLYKYRIPRIRLSKRASRYDPKVVRAWLAERTTKGGKETSRAV